MRELKATDKITQKMTRDGAVSENLATGEVEHISSREPETELSASSEESAGAAADLALRAAEHHEKKSARKAEKADTQAVRDGSAARQRPSSRLQFTEEERADPALGKYIDRSDRAADRLDAAKAAIPTKKVLRTERVFDETAGKGKTQLHFEEVEKRPNGRLRHNPLSRPVHDLVHAAHAKVHEVEQENVGVEAGHKGEVLTERGFAYGKGKVRAAVHHHRTKPWRDAAKAEQASFKANADYLYQKALHDDPALAASNPVSRFLQKQRIKRNYAKELRQAEKTAKNTAATAKSAAQKAKDAFKETFLYIKHHSRAVLLVIGIGACVALLFGGVSSCSMMAGSGVGGVFTSSYLSEDADMLAAEAAYCELEQELQYELDHYEALHPGYDEYRFDLDEIEHDPYVLISILTAFHEGVFTIDEVQEELQMLFEKQYILTQTVEVEVRYRTETRTDSEGNDYDVEVPYNYYICKVKLENFDLSHVPVYIMDEETLSLYAVYMATLGNREDLFPSSGYVDKYTKPPTTYDIPPSTLEDENFAALITEAEKYIGYPYVWGGSNPNTSFDCSGFVSWVLTQSGVCNTGRLGAQGLYNISTPVSSANARPGDLIFFVGTYDTPGVSHVGIYVGGGKMLHCGDPIQYADINTSYVAMNLSFACSLRMGEILGLTWENVHISDEDIAADNAYVYIDKELTRASKRAIETLGEKDIYYIFTPLMPNTSTRIVLKKPKTDSSIRKVWLPKTLAYILREWKKSQDELKGFLGDEYQDFDLVVALPNGRPCEDRIILKEFAKLREDAGLPKVVFRMCVVTSFYQRPASRVYFFMTFSICAIYYTLSY